MSLNFSGYASTTLHTIEVRDADFEEVRILYAVFKLNFIFEKLKAILVENFDVVQKILNSSIMHYYVKKTSVSIEGGYPCYQKNFIERFTIPALSNSEINYLRVTDNKREIDLFLMNKYQINLPEPYLCS